MYCVVCQVRYQSEELLFCNGCQKTMCRNCIVEHNHMFERLDMTNKSQKAHEVMNIGEIQKFFDAWKMNKNGYECRNMHGEKAEYFCEVCSVAICKDCTLSQHRHHKITKIQKYNIQLQTALRGCEDMLSKKEKQMKTFLEKAKEGQASIRNQLRHEEESIAKISEEIIVKFAMILRKQEHLLQRETYTKYKEQMNQLIGVTENTESMIRMLKQARKVVKEMRLTKQLSFRQDPFKHLANINRLKTENFGISFDNLNFLSKVIKRPTDEELNEICSTIFTKKTPSAKQGSGIRRSKSLTSLTSYESHLEDLNSNYHKLQKSEVEDELTSVDEADHEFGEFYFTGYTIPLNEKRRASEDQSTIKQAATYYDVRSNRRKTEKKSCAKKKEMQQNSPIISRNETAVNNRVRFCIRPEVEEKKTKSEDISRSIYAKTKPPGKISSASSASSSSIGIRNKTMINVDRAWSPEITALKSTSHSDVRDQSIDIRKNSPKYKDIRSLSAGNINVVASPNQIRSSHHTTRVAHV